MIKVKAPVSKICLIDISHPSNVSNAQRGMPYLWVHGPSWEAGSDAKPIPVCAAREASKSGQAFE